MEVFIDGEVKRWSMAELSVADGGRKVESYHHGASVHTDALFNVNFSGVPHCPPQFSLVILPISRFYCHNASQHSTKTTLVTFAQLHPILFPNNSSKSKQAEQCSLSLQAKNDKSNGTFYGFYTILQTVSLLCKLWCPYLHLPVDDKNRRKEKYE